MANNDHLEIAYTSMALFQNDGKLDEDEFNQLLDIALKDGNVNDDEKRVLNSILDRLKDDEITKSFESRIKEVKEKYGL
jgi:hypothetical protein